MSQILVENFTITRGEKLTVNLAGSYFMVLASGAALDVEILINHVQHGVVRGVGAGFKFGPGKFNALTISAPDASADAIVQLAVGDVEVSQVQLDGGTRDVHIVSADRLTNQPVPVVNSIFGPINVSGDGADAITTPVVTIDHDGYNTMAGQRGSAYVAQPGAVDPERAFVAVSVNDYSYNWVLSLHNWSVQSAGEVEVFLSSGLNAAGFTLEAFVQHKQAATDLIGEPLIVSGAAADANALGAATRIFKGPAADAATALGSLQIWMAELIIMATGPAQEVALTATASWQDIQKFG